jgi:hypothetical protein
VVGGVLVDFVMIYANVGLEATVDNRRWRCVVMLLAQPTHLVDTGLFCYGRQRIVFVNLTKSQSPNRKHGRIRRLGDKEQGIIRVGELSEEALQHGALSLVARH